MREQVRVKAEYPTIQHEQASKVIANFFSRKPYVDAVLLIGSCARGKATRDSCLDILVLVSRKVLSAKRPSLEQEWNDLYGTDVVFKRLLEVGAYSHVDLEFVDGCFAPKPRTWTSGPDEFELDIGNTLVYSVPLLERGNRLRQLKAKWLTYYDETLRLERLKMVLLYCRNNLDHVPLYVDRGLYFQAFHRLYDASREFLQALFVSRRMYPIAYDKWIKEQVEEILGMPELYPQLTHLFEIEHFENGEIAEKAELLNHLVEKYVKK